MSPAATLPGERHRPGKFNSPPTIEYGREFTCDTCAFFTRNSSWANGLLTERFFQMLRATAFLGECNYPKTLEAPRVKKYPDQGCIWWERKLSPETG